MRVRVCVPAHRVDGALHRQLLFAQQAWRTSTLSPVLAHHLDAALPSFLSHTCDMENAPAFVIEKTNKGDK